METWRRLATGLLLTFVVFTAGYAVGKEVGVRRALERLPRASAPASESPPVTEAPARRLVAWYFHATKRCKKCNTIEAYAKEALDTRFADRMTSGEISWQVANMDDVWNQDAVRRYGLLRSSLVFVELVDGVEEEHQVLDRVWDLTDDKAAFLAFVESEVEMVFDGWADTDVDAEAGE